MLRFILHAVPLLLLLLALFGFAVELFDLEPRNGSVIRLALLDSPRVPAQVVIGAWLVEASALVALFLLAQGRCGAWWLDGLVAGWVAWTFRGPLLVITIVVAARQPQAPWWTLAFGWWVLYSLCGLSLAVLARWAGLEAEPGKEAISAPEGDEPVPEPAPAAAMTTAPSRGGENAASVDAPDASEDAGPTESDFAGSDDAAEPAVGDAEEKDQDTAAGSDAAEAAVGGDAPKRRADAVVAAAEES